MAITGVEKLCERIETIQPNEATYAAEKVAGRQTMVCRFSAGLIAALLFQMLRLSTEDTTTSDGETVTNVFRSPNAIGRPTSNQIRRLAATNPPPKQATATQQPTTE